MRTAVISVIVVILSVAAFGQNVHTYSVTANGFNLQASGTFNVRGTKLTNNVHGGPGLTGQANQVVNLNLTVTSLGNTVTFTDADSYTNSFDYNGQGVTAITFTKTVSTLNPVSMNITFVVFFNQASLDSNGTAPDNIVTGALDPNQAIIYTGLEGTITTNGVSQGYECWQIVDPNALADGLQYVQGRPWNNGATSGAISLIKH